MEIDPPSARIEVRGERGIASGQGRLRQIRIDDPSRAARIVASCDGYQTTQQSLVPKSGQSENLRIVLERLPPAENSDPPPQAKPDLARPKNPVAPPRGNVLAGAVFAMNFDVDAKGVMPFVGFNSNTYSAEGRGGVSVDGKVGKAVRFANGSFLAIRGKFPSGQQPRTVSVWLKAAAGKEDQGYALVFGDSCANSQISRFRLFAETGVSRRTAVLPPSIAVLPRMHRGTTIASSTTERH